MTGLSSCSDEDGGRGVIIRPQRVNLNARGSVARARAFREWERR